MGIGLAPNIAGGLNTGSIVSSLGGPYFPTGGPPPPLGGGMPIGDKGCGKIDCSQRYACYNVIQHQCKFNNCCEQNWHECCDNDNDGGGGGNSGACSTPIDDPGNNAGAPPRGNLFGGLHITGPGTNTFAPIPGQQIPIAVPNSTAGYRADASVQVQLAEQIIVCGLFIYCPQTGVSLRSVSPNAIFYFTSSATVSFQTAGGAGGYCPSSSGHTFSSASVGGITPSSSAPYPAAIVNVSQSA